MTDKELLKQLKTLKSIRLSEETKCSNRDLLLSQISNTKSAENSKSYSAFNFKNFIAVFSQPLLVVAGVFVLVVTSLVLGNGFLRNSKPNNSLYIARIISEKAKLNTTFSQNQRDKLSIQFASDHAHDILNVLMDPEFNNEENQAQVEKLSSSFMSEISKVKTKMEKNTLKDEEKKEEEVENDIILASSLSEENGIEVEELSIDIIEEVKIEDEVEDLVTSSEEEIIEPELKKEEDLVSETDIILEIEKLFSDGAYPEALEKLDEVKKSLKNN